MTLPTWLKRILGIVTQPTQYVTPKCPICGKPLESFPGSPYQMCENGHKFGPGMKEVPLINDGDFHGDL